jgi:hypothetical protein
LTIAQRTGTGRTTTALGAGRRATTAPLGPTHPARTTPLAQTTALASVGMVISARASMPVAKIRVFITLLLLIAGI